MIFNDQVKKKHPSVRKKLEKVTENKPLWPEHKIFRINKFEMINYQLDRSKDEVPNNQDFQQKNQYFIKDNHVETNNLSEVVS